MLNFIKFVKKFDNLFLERGSNFEVYVMNFFNILFSVLFCDLFKSFYGGYEKVNINCIKY